MQHGPQIPLKDKCPIEILIYCYQNIDKDSSQSMICDDAELETTQMFIKSMMNQVRCILTK
jgi:hypothetical protein